MTDDTRASIDTAISAHIADSFPGYYTSGWVIVVASSALDNPGATNYRLISADNQPFHTDEGLLNVGRRIMTDSWDAEDDDD